MSINRQKICSGYMATLPFMREIIYPHEPRCYVLFGTRRGSILSAAAEVPDSGEGREAAAPWPRLAYQLHRLIAA